MSESTESKGSENAAAPAEKKASKKASKKATPKRAGRPGLKGNHRAAS